MKKLLVIILILIIVFVGINYYNNIKKINELQLKIDNLNSKIESSKEEKNELQKELENINNRDFIEKIAREKLGLVKPGEVLVVPVEEKNEN